MIYDVIIIGSGAGGLTAGIFAGRYKLKTLIIGKDFGLTSQAPVIENWPGIKKISGMELIKLFKEHAQEYVKIVNEEVISIKKGFIVKTSENEYQGKNIILAMGMARKKLNLKNEDKYLGKGLSYCVSCDAPLFKNKTVAVIGGSDSAVIDALMLKEYAKKVYIIHRGGKLNANPTNMERIRDIEVITKANIKEIKGMNFVEEIILNNKKKIKLDGIFIDIGVVPSIALTKNLGIKLKNGFILVNKEQRTNVKNVYAVGDITNFSELKQIITASAQGAIAAFSIYKNGN